MIQIAQVILTPKTAPHPVLKAVTHLTTLIPITATVVILNHRAPRAPVLQAVLAVQAPAVHPAHALTAQTLVNLPRRLHLAPAAAALTPAPAHAAAAAAPVQIRAAAVQTQVPLVLATPTRVNFARSPAQTPAAVLTRAPANRRVPAASAIRRILAAVPTAALANRAVLILPMESKKSASAGRRFQ